MGISSAPLPISVCILVKDEEANLPRCLAPLHPFAEVLVCDTGSRDRSVEIARSAGARILTQVWQGFSETRRAHFSAATQPWILWLDADEVLLPELVLSIAQAVGSPGSALGFRLNRQVIFNGQPIRHGDWFPDWNLRLFRASHWHMEARLVHESVKVPGPTPKLSGLALHYSFRDLSDLHQRSLRYAKLWAEMVHQQGRSVGPLAPYSRAIWKWFRGYILKRGFLDRRLGFQIANANASEVYRKYQGLRQLQR
ncbi:MAG: glycosyltransferase family 2 protein [Puniceicoccaceae bacterium]